MQDAKHLSFESIEKFVEGKLRGDKLLELEEHIAVCPECKKKVHALRDFSSIWNKWTATAHGEAYRKADKKKLVAIRKELSERKAEALMERFLDITGKSPAHLKKKLEAIGQNLNDIFRKTFTFPTPSFAPVFGEYPVTILSPFGKVRYPIIFKWRPYRGADQYIISIEEVNWSYTTSGTKVEVNPQELELVYGNEYMWELKVTRADKIIEEENGFFKLPTEEETKEMKEIEHQIGQIKSKEERFLLWGGILEGNEFYMEAIENYMHAYNLEPSPGVAYRIAGCYDQLELEELREKWNKKTGVLLGARNGG